MKDDRLAKVQSAYNPENAPMIEEISPEEKARQEAIRKAPVIFYIGTIGMFNDSEEKEAKQVEHAMRTEYVAPPDEAQALDPTPTSKAKGRKSSVLMLDPEELQKLVDASEDEGKDESKDSVEPLGGKTNEKVSPQDQAKAFARAPTITVVPSSFNDTTEKDRMQSENEMRTEYADLLKKNEEEAEAGRQQSMGPPRRQSLVLKPAIAVGTTDSEGGDVTFGVTNPTGE